jgi:hypothetical protein
VIPLTPEQKKDAISKHVEANLGSLLEDLIVGAWLVYGLSYNEPDSELHELASGIINTFELHNFGWQTSRLIPSRMTLEGEDITLEERITQYCDRAREVEAEIRQNLVMMIAAIKIKSSGHTQSLMHQWAALAMKRHDMNFDEQGTTTPIPNFVRPRNKRVQ